MAAEAELAKNPRSGDALVMTAFAKALDAADKLSLDEQEEPSSTLRHRIAERRRAELFEAVKEARAEFVEGRLKAASPAAILKLIKG